MASVPGVKLGAKDTGPVLKDFTVLSGREPSKQKSAIEYNKAGIDSSRRCQQRKPDSMFFLLYVHNTTSEVVL